MREKDKEESSLLVSSGLRQCEQNNSSRSHAKESACTRVEVKTRFKGRLGQAIAIKGVGTTACSIHPSPKGSD